MKNTLFIYSRRIKSVLCIAYWFCFVCILNSCGSHESKLQLPKDLLSAKQNLVVDKSTEKLSLQEIWRVAYKGQSYPLEAILVRDINHWQFVLMNNLGQRLMSVDTQNSAQVICDKSHPLYPVYLELLYATHWIDWPQEQLNMQANWQVLQKSSGREIYFSGILHAIFEEQIHSKGERFGIYKTYDRHGNLILQIELNSLPLE